MAKRLKTEHVHVHVCRPSSQNIDDNEDILVQHENPTFNYNLNMFMKWCKDVGLGINKKVEVSKLGSCSNYGMVAVSDIAASETLFTIPREALLHPENCSISSLLWQAENELTSPSGWTSLLLCLMYEYTKQDSKWRPYLDLCPDYTQLDPPLFWEEVMVSDELQGTGIPELVEKDAKNIQEEYYSVAVPFMKKHPQEFDLKVHTLDLYRKMVAFILAYSFTEPKKSMGTSQEDEDGEDDDEDEDEDELLNSSVPPMMVPMADILNHVAKNNARLQFGEKNLSMVSTRRIKKGEEVFNTYGQLNNSHLMHMYGFAELYPANIYDSVDIPSEHLKSQSNSSLHGDLTISQWEFVTEREETYDKFIVVGCNGIINTWETYNTLKILSMTPVEFEEFYKQIGDEDDSDDEDDSEDLEEQLSFDGMTDLPASWKALLQEVAVKHLASYKNSLEDDLQLLKEESRLTSRQIFALYVRIGQKKLVEKVVAQTQ